MYRVLLVDDEELDLEGMRRFTPWDELGMEVKGCANNALSARAILESQPIDILVSDVNMPYMSGLELARGALENNPHLRVIFVSGHQEFSYVQQALSMKAYSYVLKPMDDRELAASLLKVKRDLDEERRQRERESAYEELIPIAKSDLLIRLLEGALADPDPALSRQLASYGFERIRYPARVAVMELDHAAVGQKGVLMPPQEWTQASLRQLHAHIQALGGIPYCKLSAQRIALVVVDHDDPDAMLLGLARAVERHANATITTGLGAPVTGLQGLADSYRQSVAALAGKMFFGKGGVIKYEEVRAEPGMLDARELDTRMNALLAAMEAYEVVRVYDEFENLFRSIAALRSRFTVHNLLGYMVWKADQYLSGRGEDLFSLLGIEIRHLDVLMQLETVADIRTWLMQFVYEISERLHEKSMTKDSKFIRGVVKAMTERMGENIQLKDIAAQFSFSPSYMGVLIKEKSGSTFNELLANIRMEKACELLHQPGIKIYEVADLVGYRYLPYFSRQFKEKFGMTPIEYRKRTL
ncbi:response regulator [Paenibacillus aurantiacus]|uniref:Response regulator n=1 Tax=Paenibacillus aurantiacus TaxID=1936118 RepID=A0ABV5KZD3_9BACL